MNIQYGVMRFRQEYERLTYFYTSRAKKMKHAAKIVAWMNNYDLKEA